MAGTDVSSERKSYEQLCPMATALDYVGDRWTILILRELLGGPAQFQVLRNGLPGIATNLLTGRLRRMQADGLVRRIDPGGSNLYTLTESGAGIRTAIEELGMWGARMGRVGSALHQRSIRAVAMALQAVLVRAGDALPTSVDVIELRVDGDYAEILLGPKPMVTARMPIQSEAQVATTHSQMSAFLMGEVDAGEALEHLSGNAEASRRLVTALS